ncbi:Uncharacterized protein HZ326_5977 [Fusarium oxysporum f. sp. albedinis]|nr:Uncharacterized protein HZ326_5977 [Fusarium oxysporum f. sp. albedinis]
MKPSCFFCGPPSAVWYPHGSEVSKLFVPGSSIESRRLLGVLPLLVARATLFHDSWVHALLEYVHELGTWHLGSNSLILKIKILQSL